MNTQELRDEIIKKINDLNDADVLLSLKNLINMPNENLASFLKIANENLLGEQFSETEDFSGYIKEWVKSM